MKINKHTWLVYTDGASRGNPGPSGVGIYVVDQDGSQILKDHFYIGEKTNNQAEYLAVAFATFLLKNIMLKKEITPDLIFISDSQLLVRQMDGLYRVKNPTISCIKHAIDKNLEDVSCQFKHVLRKENLVADSLANMGINKKRKIPEKLLRFSIDHNIPL
jgi:ribonuclease HI